MGTKLQAKFNTPGPDLLLLFNSKRTNDTYLPYNNIRTGFLITGLYKEPYANPIQERAGPDTENSGRAGRPRQGAT